MAEIKKNPDEEQDYEPFGVSPVESDNESEFYGGTSERSQGYYGNPNDAENHGDMRPEQAAGQGAGADFGLKEEPTHEPGRPDPEIHKDLMALLRQRGDVDEKRIAVEVLKGEVTLTGAATRQTKRMAEKLADGVAGVRSVRNQIEEKTE